MCSSDLDLALEFQSLRDRPPAELAAQVGLVGPLGKYVLGIWRFGWGDQACATLLRYAGARINTWRKLVDQGSFHAVQAQPWPPAPPYSRLARLHSAPLLIYLLPKLKVVPTTFRAAFQADTDRAMNAAILVPIAHHQVEQFITVVHTPAGIYHQQPVGIAIQRNAQIGTVLSNREIGRAHV